MRINFNPGLNIKTKDKPVIKASAEQLADAGKLVWRVLASANKQSMLDTYIPFEMPKRYNNGEEFVKWATVKKGEVFKKNFLGVYKLNEKGKDIMKNMLKNMDLPEHASLETFIFRVIRRFKGIR